MVTFSFLGREAVPVPTAPPVPDPVPIPVPTLDPTLDLVDALVLDPRDVLVALPRFAPGPAPAPGPVPAPAPTRAHAHEAAPPLAVLLHHLPNQRSM